MTTYLEQMLDYLNAVRCERAANIPQFRIVNQAAGVHSRNQKEHCRPLRMVGKVCKAINAIVHKVGEVEASERHALALRATAVAAEVDVLREKAGPHKESKRPQEVLEPCARTADPADDVRVGGAEFGDHHSYRILCAGAEAALFRMSDTADGHQDAADVDAQARPTWQPVRHCDNGCSVWK